MSDPLIRVEGVSKLFGRTAAVADVSVEIGAGEFFALLGASGCGKTTLLRMIAGLETPNSGRILIEGRDMAGVPPWRRPVNTVFQSYALFPHMTVAGNIAFGLKQDGLPAGEIKSRVAEMLELVQLSGFADRKPGQLSGGQRQRVALARSLAKRPKALLLDEPLAALDRKLRDQMQVELAALQRRLGISFIFVTHDQDEAMALAQRIAVMRDGRIEQIGAPREVYEKPATRFVADFLGRANVIGGRVAGRDGAFLRIDTGQDGLVLRALSPLDIAAGTEAWVAVRPENITFEECGHANRADGVVRAAAYVGGESRYELAIAGGVTVRATVPNRAGDAAPHPPLGASVRLSWPAEAGILLLQ
ncbi:MAG TPA: ABC transporter ATP-binding protein [Alphaproteobacteria bacterium]|nr:ABC transporter ATP-binding protein [Alphaproteobacteria bacterium]